MKLLRPEQIGVCSWSTGAGDPGGLADFLDRVGLKKVQLALAPVVEKQGVWGGVKEKLGERGVRIVSGMFGTIGEDYTTLESIRRTGGVADDGLWEANLERIKKVVGVAAGMGLALVSFHAGFLPEDERDARRGVLVERVGRIADLFAEHQIAVLLETGQESAGTLVDFLRVVETKGHGNVGVNFDPANMLLYNMGEPVDALRGLLPWVRQIHIKDAVRTAREGEWGVEVRVGEGDVDWVEFVKVLKKVGYDGNLMIEREAGEGRLDDILGAKEHMMGVMLSTKN